MKLPGSIQLHAVLVPTNVDAAASVAAVGNRYWNISKLNYLHGAQRRKWAHVAQVVAA
jgi:hypothetical protein